MQFLVALIGLGVAIDYALLMIFRFREELQHGEDARRRSSTTMRHAGRSVIVSGSTVAIGLLSLVILPLPFIRSIGIGGHADPRGVGDRRDHPAAGAAVILGHGSTALRVLPERLVVDADPERGFWGRWATPSRAGPGRSPSSAS